MVSKSRNYNYEKNSIFLFYLAGVLSTRFPNHIHFKTEGNKHTKSYGEHNDKMDIHVKHIYNTFSFSNSASYVCIDSENVGYFV